jgi:hypothetical protein
MQVKIQLKHFICKPDILYMAMELTSGFSTSTILFDVILNNF